MSTLWKRDLGGEEESWKFMIECPVCGYRFRPSFKTGEKFPVKSELATFVRCPKCHSWIVMHPMAGSIE